MCAAKALQKLIKLHTRVDPLFTELHNGVKNTEDNTIRLERLPDFVFSSAQCLIVIPNCTFWYSSVVYQASLVERDQTCLICRRIVPKTTWLGIYRAQIRSSDHDIVAISGQWLDIAGCQGSRYGFWLANCEFGYGNALYHQVAPLTSLPLHNSHKRLPWKCSYATFEPSKSSIQSVDSIL